MLLVLGNKTHSYENSIGERLAENESLEDKRHPEHVLSVIENMKNSIKIYFPIYEKDPAQVVFQHVESTMKLRCYKILDRLIFF